MRTKPELIAPAGNMECARAAVANGADAVYFGLQRFNARMRADNFTEEQLPELVGFLHDHRVRAFCTLNTLVFTDELADAERELILLDDSDVDAVLIQDLGVAALARELKVRMELHASTQMTITSPEGMKFVGRLGIERVVLAREASLREMAKLNDDPTLPALEVFVHGALCVAYSGQCLTSEALGQRSANRGECAQACRLPYELIVDGILKDLGDRRYLLSPQDLAAVREIADLIRFGVSGFKIEGRLKTPEYVAATCQVYRQAIDEAISGCPSNVSPADKYKLEMTFSRGLYSGWLHGVNHQELVHACYGKKRGAFVGCVTGVRDDHVEVDLQAPLRAGDGVVFENGRDTDHEQGGRVWQIRDQRLYFERGHIDFRRLTAGDRVWKTSDPQLERALRKTYTSEIPRPKTQIDITVTGSVGKPLSLESNGIRVSSSMVLQIAYKRPMTKKLLRDQLSRLGDTNFVLGEIHNRLDGQVILPVSELNRLRRDLVARLESNRRNTSPHTNVPKTESPCARHSYADLLPQRPQDSITQSPRLIVLCRTMEQLAVALDEASETVYVDFEDIRRYHEAVSSVRSRGNVEIFLATPRIQKVGEQAFFKLIDAAKPDGVLIRNLGALDYFRDSPLRKIGDFSLNVANPITADLLIREGLERVTPCYDLNAQQLLDLLQAAPPTWFDLTIHQHMPMFHMEHCVFAAFLSNGTDASNCGRPCDHHNLKLRDRVGVDHPVKADVGCRNTVFHAKAQSGADYLRAFMEAGARVFRVELLEEDAVMTRRILQSYRELIAGAATESSTLFRHLNVVKQLGVTSGTLTVLS
ncbi:MAG TPA: U32 family peptidase [Verrucomicrobiae bacterium]|nr:U32 family peptidase [Verrucomicrobiae bacterium]